MSQTTTKANEREIELEIARIRKDGGTQSRAELDPETIDEYAEAMKAGTKFPAAIVYYDGTDYWLSDGFHRIEAAKQTDLKTLQVNVRQGTLRDAILCSLSANAQHGLRRKNADKRRAVVRMLSDAEWCLWSNNQIAKQCSVTEGFVRAIKAELSSNDTKIDSESAKEYGVDQQTLKEAQTRIQEAPTFRKVQRGGKTYTINPTNIGQYKKKEETAQPPPAAAQQKPIEIVAIRSKEEIERSEVQEDILPVSNSLESSPTPKGTWWNLGDKHWICWGEPTDREWMERLKEPITLAIVLSEMLDESVFNLLKEPISTLLFTSKLVDFDWETIALGIEEFVKSSTNSFELVVIYWVPSPDILYVVDKLGCRFIAIEPDRDRVMAIVEAWQKRHSENAIAQII